jgi:hypothetical protein
MVGRGGETVLSRGRRFLKRVAAPALIAPALAVSLIGVGDGVAEASSVPSAKIVIQDLIKAGTPSRITVVFTAATDPNHRLGRPNQYTSKASFSDRRVPSSDTVGDTKGSVDFGGSVEVFPNASEAKARAAYIQSVLKADPMLGTEYDYLNGPVLLRVSQYLTPSEAHTYKVALGKIRV